MSSKVNVSSPPRNLQVQNELRFPSSSSCSSDSHPSVRQMDKQESSQGRDVSIDNDPECLVSSFDRTSDLRWMDYLLRNSFESLHLTDLLTDRLIFVRTETESSFRLAQTRPGAPKLADLSLVRGFCFCLPLSIRQ